MRDFNPPHREGRATDRLTKARLAAGFRTGHLAAEAHGWPVGTYVAVEGGRRPLTPERAARYGEAFSVPAEWLLGREPNDAGTDAACRAVRLDAVAVAEVPLEFASPDVAAVAVAGAGGRLAQARLDAGFRTLQGAARRLRLSISTLQSHEIGRTRVGVAAARMYGAAYGADVDWLMTGRFTGSAAGRAGPTRGERADADRVAELVSQYRAARRPSSVIPPHPATPVSPVDLAALLGSLTEGSVRPLIVAEVVGPVHGEYLRAGDRVLVDTGRTKGLGLMARAAPGGGVRLFRSTADSSGDVLGTVVALLPKPS
ncbi:helix-turn-helix transcriptional regulator [Methylobacterium oryzae]|uniref:HTH cro/C1-type domain-containing protein n=1 Tax=Methylobacterium oryzae TaxID=334852 RepID=A0ABU7TR88_9HYPH